MRGINSDVRTERRATRWSLVLILLFACTGATCAPWERRPVHNDAPIVFEHTPTLGEVIATVNNNSRPIRQLQADGVRISAPGVPSIRATLALEPPRNLRIQGEFLTARELDIGSNEEVFWIWSKHATEALLYARHSDYAAGPAMELVPVEPTWLIDALGVLTFDPAAQHSGPFAHGPGEMEVHSQFVSPKGEALTKITVLNAIYGWVTEQTIRDSRGRLLASAKASQHRYYSDVGVTLPDVVDVQIAPGQPTEMAFRIDIGGYRINQLGTETADQWTMPVIEDYPHVDLADPRSYENLHRAGHSAIGPPAPQRDDRATYRPQYRGYTR